jgi:hypothetical protein
VAPEPLFARAHQLGPFGAADELSTPAPHRRGHEDHAPLLMILLRRLQAEDGSLPISIERIEPRAPDLRVPQRPRRPLPLEGPDLLLRRGSRDARGLPLPGRENRQAGARVRVVEPDAQRLHAEQQRAFERLPVADELGVHGFGRAAVERQLRASE